MIKVIVAESSDEILDNFSLRSKIFIEGQNVSFEEEMDGLDDVATLIVAYYNDIPIGCGRYRLIDYYAKIERIGVLEEYRQMGIGKLIMEFIEEEIRSNTKVELLKLNAQTHAKEFYTKLGYSTKGELFLEANIEHIQMVKAI